MWRHGPDDRRAYLVRVTPSTAELRDGLASNAIAAFEFVKWRLLSGQKPISGRIAKARPRCEVKPSNGTRLPSQTLPATGGDDGVMIEEKPKQFPEDAGLGQKGPRTPCAVDVPVDPRRPATEPDYFPGKPGESLPKMRSDQSSREQSYPRVSISWEQAH
jgi:hypothetical protein